MLLVDVAVDVGISVGTEEAVRICLALRTVIYVGVRLVELRGGMVGG